MPKKKKYKDISLFKTEQIQIYPNEKQKFILQRWLDNYKDIYNWTIKHLRKVRGGNIGTLIDLRKEVKPTLMPDMMSFKIPSHTIDQAIFDAHKGYKIWLMSKKKRPMRYKKKSTCLVLEPTTFNGQGFCKSVLGKDMASTKPLTDIDISCNVRLTFRKNNFILNIPIKKCKSYITNNKQRCGIDGGSRTFLTVYNPTFGSSTFGDNMTKLDKLIELKRRDSDKFRTPKQEKKFKERIRRNIKNYVNELHWKSILELVRTYDEIVLGKLSTKGISSKSKKSGLTPFQKDKFSALSHFTFRTRLEHKCNEYKCKLYVVSEYMTSKTCSCCGHINKNLGASKIYNCSKCGLYKDRDVNASINILRKIP